MAADTVSSKELCRLLAGTGHEPLTEMSLSNFVADGMPKAARGKYDALECLQWYVGRLRTANQRRTAEDEDEGLPSMDKVERRLKLAKAISEEMTVAERKKELMPVHLHESELTHLVQVTKQRILNIPARLAQKLEGLTTLEIKTLLGVALKEALSELARKEVSVAKAKASDSGPAKTRRTSRSRHARKPRARK